MDNEIRHSEPARACPRASSPGDGCSRQTINSIETGRYTPSLPLAIALARFFAQPVEEVFHANGTP